MSRSIKLTRSAQQPIVIEDGSLGYRFTVVASDAVSMENEVFKMNQRPLNPGETAIDYVSDFHGICTISDLQDLPIDNPLPPDTRFRVASIDVDYLTQAQGDDAWDEIKLGVETLVRALNIADNLNIVEVVQIG